MCDCRLLWLYELRNRTRSGLVQKSLDNVNCDLRERNERPEQVYLLRLHYENFDCESTIATTELSIPFREAKYSDNNLRSGGEVLALKASLMGVFIILLSCTIF